MSSNHDQALNKVAHVLGSIRMKGGRVWAENGQLRYRAPKGSMTPEEIECLRTSKRSIVALLAGDADPAITELTPRPGRLDLAPLAFSQLAHWQMYRLCDRPAIREIASATRLNGRLNISALRESIEEIVHRHEALRTQIVMTDGIPMQKISKSIDCHLRVEDLTKTSEGLLEEEVTRRMEQLILEPVDVGVDPLFGIRLLKLRDDEHVLIIAMEHMIADMFSVGLLWRDVFAAYVQTFEGRAYSLPPVPVQFADYAIWQRNTEKSWIEKHGPYWNRRMKGCSRLRFPTDCGLHTAHGPGWGTVRLRIGKHLKAELSEWCRTRRTTLAMSMFTAFVALVLRWCGVPEAVFRFVSDGRVSPNIENTIGFFASILYLRIESRETDNFVDLMNRATQEYCQAYEHADFFYLSTQEPQPEFTRSITFNWVPLTSKIDFSGLDGTKDAITWRPIPRSHPGLRNLELDQEPVMLLYDIDDEVVGGLHFPLNRFSRVRMEEFGHHLLMLIRELIRQPEMRVKDIPLP